MGGKRAAAPASRGDHGGGCTAEAARRNAALLLAGWLLPSIVFAGTCPPACGTPASGGEFPRVADCLFILRTSVGMGACFPECICRLAGSEGVSVVDALACLTAAVGPPVQ